MGEQGFLQQTFQHPGFCPRLRSFDLLRRELGHSRSLEVIRIWTPGADQPGRYVAEIAYGELLNQSQWNRSQDAVKLMLCLCRRNRQNKSPLP